MSLESSSPLSSNNYQFSLDLSGSPAESYDSHQANLNSNLPVISHTKMYKCKQCVFVCMNKEDYWQHQRQMHIKPDKLLACTKCSFVTEYKHHLEYHFRNHMGSKPYKCTQCEYACINLSMLRSHLKSHSKALQYTCADCTYSTKYYHSLKTHLEKFGHSASDNPSTVSNPTSNNRTLSKKQKDLQTTTFSKSTSPDSSSIPSSKSSSLSSSPSFTSPTSSIISSQSSNNTSNLLNKISLTAALTPYQNSNPLLPLFAAAAAAAQQSNNDLNLIQQQMQLQIALAAAAASGNSASPFLVQSLADFFIQQEQTFQKNNSSFLMNPVESNEKCENIDPNDLTMEHSPSSTSSMSSSTLLQQQNKSIKCKLCNFKFDNKKDLKKHVKSNHETEKQKNVQVKPSQKEQLFECRKCKLFFRNQETLTAHNMMHDLQDSQNSSLLTQQQHILNSGNNLVNQQQVNTSEQLKCIQCGINCQNPFQYIIHLQTFHNSSLMATH